MTENQFYHLTSANSTVRRAEWVAGEMELEKVTCPVNEGHRRGGKRLTNLSVALRGNGVEDFVWTWLSECLIQDHVRDLFRKNEFTGFDVKPVKARFKRISENVPPRLWELIVIGWAGMASAESGINLTKECIPCGLLRYSCCKNPAKLIDISQWDGSDFFMVWPLPGFIFITERVAQTIRDARLTGTDLVRPANISLGMSPGFGPGRLSYWMPEDRAHKLGGALGIE